jgi:hypothetical protein
METPEVIKNYVEAWSNADVDSCIAPFGTDGTYCDPVVPKKTLAPQLKEHWAAFFSGFSDLVVSVNWWKSSWHQLSASEQLTILLPTLLPFAD